MFVIHSTAQLKWIESHESFMSTENWPRELRRRAMDRWMEKRGREQTRWKLYVEKIATEHLLHWSAKLCNIFHISFVVIVKCLRISHMDALPCKPLRYASNQSFYINNNMQYAICVRVIDLVNVLNYEFMMHFTFLIGLPVLFMKYHIALA